MVVAGWGRGGAVCGRGVDVCCLFGVSGLRFCVVGALLLEQIAGVGVDEAGGFLVGLLLLLGALLALANRGEERLEVGEEVIGRDAEVPV